MAEITVYFEDNFLKNFHPLTLTRPLFDLRLGILTLGEKWNHDLEIENKPSGIVRHPLNGLFSESEVLHDDTIAYWINPRVLPDKHVVNAVQNLAINSACLHDNSLIAAKIDHKTHNRWLSNGIDYTELKQVEANQSCSLLSNSWDLFQQNGQEIKNDIKRLNHVKPVNPDDFPGATFVNSEQIFVREGATFEPGTIIIADDGPVYIGKNARIMAQSVIRGTTAVCDHATVKMGAKIYGDTTIGPVCKVGGEIASVIFHSYSNKAHDGFTGNSIFGQWCNLGADTNTSNLKNNYSNIRINDWESGEEIDTGQQFLGTIMGDHSKTGINAMLTTGTVCGVSCNLFAVEYHPKLIRSFSWLSNNGAATYRFDKAISAMQKMMARRDIELTPAYRNMMKSIFESSE
ncbi:glucose-1-phosphate thymidylyltransferase [Rhodohalobacter sp. SW132]|uniref:putative sugar nucleotidyl transferase n=1 Tax=Rhodohalobacter sp. SW132 TaxID=2293433 RepID=UPI000E249922|nr:putative sugar nucleotidyl transferase [Rhodohalobacter sp. SW132]REL33255.1 glucose-1-phosphate thymidylyltransferase [Rhodohalobacter sp. SW132]